MKDTHQPKLYFVAIGPQRTGISCLHRVMENPPSIALPNDIKETMFFDKYYQKGDAWFFSHFKIEENNRVLGEIAPTYFGSQIVVDRIKSDHPDCKFFINIRNPVDHALSMYQHEVSKGRIEGNLVDIFQENSEKNRPSLYAEWIPRWQATFGEDNICLIWMDQIRAKAEEVHRQVCEFVSIEHCHYSQSVDNRKVNATKESRHPKVTKFGLSVYHLLREYRLHSIINFCKRIRLGKITFGSAENHEKQHLTYDEFNILAELYSDDIDYLEKISGENISSWRSSEKIKNFRRPNHRHLPSKINCNSTTESAQSLMKRIGHLIFFTVVRKLAS